MCEPKWAPVQVMPVTGRTKQKCILRCDRGKDPDFAQAQLVPDSNLDVQETGRGYGQGPGLPDICDDAPQHLAKSS